MGGDKKPWPYTFQNRHSLKTPFSQDYDALFMELQDAITEYKLTVPPIFDKEPEHTVLTYFNESKGAEETPNEIDGRKKRAAKKLVKSLVETETLGAMSKRTYRDIEGKTIEYKTMCKPTHSILQL